MDTLLSTVAGSSNVKSVGGGARFQRINNEDMHAIEINDYPSVQMERFALFSRRLFCAFYSRGVRHSRTGTYFEHAYPASHIHIRTRVIRRTCIST